LPAAVLVVDTVVFIVVELLDKVVTVVEVVVLVPSDGVGEVRNHKENDAVKIRIRAMAKIYLLVPLATLLFTISHVQPLGGQLITLEIGFSATIIRRAHVPLPPSPPCCFRVR